MMLEAVDGSLRQQSAVWGGRFLYVAADFSLRQQIAVYGHVLNKPLQCYIPNDVHI